MSLKDMEVVIDMIYILKMWSLQVHVNENFQNILRYGELLIKI